MATNLALETLSSLTQEPSEVYQQAALNLRYKKITAITPTKLERTISLLKLGPDHLVQRGLAPRSLLAQELDRSGDEERGQQQQSSLKMTGTSDDVEGKCPPQKDPNKAEEEHDDTQEDQDHGWGDYEDDYDSDSDIDDHDDQQEGIEGRRKGPIYAFLVYGGVQLRPDEYVLLFRALGVSPQYIEQLRCSKRETGQKPYKASSDSFHAHNQHPGGTTHLDDEMLGRKASPFYSCNPDGASNHSLDGRGKMGIGLSGRNDGRVGVFERKGQIKSSHTPLRYDSTPNIYNRSGAHGLVFVDSPETPARAPSQQLPTDAIKTEIGQW